MTRRPNEPGDKTKRGQSKGLTGQGSSNSESPLCGFFTEEGDEGKVEVEHDERRVEKDTEAEGGGEHDARLKHDGEGEQAAEKGEGREMQAAKVEESRMWEET